MDSIIQQLEDGFAAQQLQRVDSSPDELEQALLTVKAYVAIENCVAVLSDLSADKSYVYGGAFAEFLGIGRQTETPLVLASKWEDVIYGKIHPDDLLERHVLELRFFHLLGTKEPSQRLDYSTACIIRALDGVGEYQHIHHRTLYLRNNSKGRLWLALCLYNFLNYAPSQVVGIQGKIINNKTGEVIPVEQYTNCTSMISSREREVLGCIRDGLASKEIAHRLHISINTVNRHRQNIFAKLGAKNAVEAVQTATAMNLI